MFEVKILLDTGLYSKNAQLSSLAFLFLVLPCNPHKLDWLFASVPHSIQVVPKKALYFLSIRAQSRCDPDLDHISIGPGLTKTVTHLWGHPVWYSMLLIPNVKVCDPEDVYKHKNKTFKKIDFH